MPKVDIAKYSPDTIQDKKRNISIDMSTPDKSVSMYFGRKPVEKVVSEKDMSSLNKNTIRTQ